MCTIRPSMLGLPAEDTLMASGPTPLGRSTPLVSPLYQSAVYTLPDLDALDEIMNSGQPGFIYIRDGHPNSRLLAEQLTALEVAEWSIITASGMAAITAIMLGTLQQGDRVVASNRLYGKTSSLLKTELSRYGVQSTFVDVGDLDQVRAALQQPAKLLFTETLSNPLLRVSDLEALAQLAHQHGCLFAVDNTFATPVLTRPLEMGADLVMESLTKMIGGHSDVMLGSISGCGELGTVLAPIVSTWGLAPNPFDCWLATRGLATLDLRMRQASANAALLAGLACGTAGRQARHLSGSIRSPRPSNGPARPPGRLEQHGRTRGDRRARGGEPFPARRAGDSLQPLAAHTSTTCSHPGTTSHRYVSPAEKRRQGIGDGLIRLSVGFEDVEQTKQEFARGLAAVTAEPQ